MLNVSNAIIAKTKAKFGNRITVDDYHKLVQCNSVTEVVFYLKSNTRYKDILTNINEHSVHRGQVETILKQKMFYDFDSLCRYEMSVGSQFSKYIVRSYEITQIIHFLTLLNANRQEDYILSTPAYFNSHTDIDLNILTKAQNYDDFLSAFSMSEYKKLLTQLRPEPGKQPNIPEIEDALYNYTYEQLNIAIDKYTSKGEREELKKMVNDIINYNNFVRILRLKKYYKEEPRFIMNHLLKNGSIRKRHLEEMCSAESAKDVFAIMLSIPQGKMLKKMRYNYAGEIARRAKFYTSRKNMYYSTSPAVVLLSYVFVTQNELSNIINIIESVRYGFDKKKTEDVLIYI